ncbi:Cation efflux system protein CusB [bacterium HR10]|nr:Cation efflux system protein CusB [bacterium HR10]
MERERVKDQASGKEDPLDVLREAHALLKEGHDEAPLRETPSGSSVGASERRGVRSRLLWIGLLLILVLIGIGLGSRYYQHRRAVEPGGGAGLNGQAQSGKAVYYCPMHPEYTSEKPGECPVCGMTLVKREEPGHPPAHEEALPPGTVRISPVKQQLIGITYGEVAFEPVVHTIRTVGKVTYDETKIARVHAKIEGWIEKVHVDYVGKFVRKGQPLLEIYSPELVATQQELLLALRAKESLGRSPYREIASGAHSLYEASRKRLELWDIPEEEIQRIQRQGEPLRTLTLYAPVTGFVLARNAFERQRVTPETELYTIADLSTVWVLVDMYEYEAPLVRVGQKATMTLPYFPGKVFHGRVAYIYPQLDPMTRTLKIRLEFPNPGLVLKPDMYANVELRIEYGRRLSVPEEAVLDSGTEQIVFVAREGGYFEPRRVRVGPKVANRYIILEGLKAGERIVTSGNFLIDSESRLQSALQGMRQGGHGGASAPGPSPAPGGHSGHRP